MAEYASWEETQDSWQGPGIKEKMHSQVIIDRSGVLRRNVSHAVLVRGCEEGSVHNPRQKENIDHPTSVQSTKSLSRMWPTLVMSNPWQCGPQHWWTRRHERSSITGSVTYNVAGSRRNKWTWNRDTLHFMHAYKDSSGQRFYCGKWRSPQNTIGRRYTTSNPNSNQSSHSHTAWPTPTCIGSCNDSSTAAAQIHKRGVEKCVHEKAWTYFCQCQTTGTSQ